MTDLEHAQQEKTAPWTDTVPELSDFHVAVFRDRYPVTPGHMLFVPRFNTEGVIRDCFDAAMRTGHAMVERGECDAFNVGMNCGSAAGQTVPYPHIHMIPRRRGDCADPTGGVRGVIAAQQNYTTTSYQKPT